MDVACFIENSRDTVRVVKSVDADATIFVFSHVGYPMGKFALSHELAGLDANIVYLNTPDNSWYQSGIGPDVPGIEETRKLIFEIRQALNAKKSYSVGMSMGGYAAVLFGLLLRMDATLAFTPETLLGKQHSRSWKLNKLRYYDSRYSDLSTLIKNNSSTIINLVYGVYDLTDLALLWKIGDQISTDRNISFLPCMDAHKIPLSVNVRELVKKMIYKNVINGNDIGKIHAPMETFDTDLLVTLRDAADLREASKHIAFRALLEEHAPDRPWRNHMIAESFRSEKRYQESIPYFYRAVAQDGTYPVSCIGLAESLEAAFRYDEATIIWQKLHDMSPHDIQFMRRGAINLMRLGIKDRSEAMYRKILTVKPDDQGALQALSALYEA